MFRLSAGNSKLNLVPIFTKTLEYLSCAHKCLSANACKSFNYNAQSKSCEALAKTRQEAGDNEITYADGWDYYEQLIHEVSYNESLQTGRLFIVNLSNSLLKILSNL